MPRPPAEDTAAARGAVEVCAIPARRIGCWIPRMVVKGVVSGPEEEEEGPSVDVAIAIALIGDLL